IFKDFKYCFMDLDIINQEIFRDLYFGLKRKRLRQGYGELYNVKVDDMDMRDEDCIENYLEYKDEEPQIVANKYIRDMTEKYRDWKKFLYIL
ncbi:MAG: hypothetical protein WA105_06885, partial [Candidatus Hydromicrobium sp.]